MSYPIDILVTLDELSYGTDILVTEMSYPIDILAT